MDSEETKELNKLWELSLDMICVANTEGFFEKINPAFTQILGYTEEDLLSKPFTDFIHPDDLSSTYAEVEKLSKGALTISFKNRYKKKDGQYIWMNWHSAPDTETGKLYAMARDVTQEIQQKNELLRANEDLDQFAAIVSHDLKSPLRGISNLATWISEDLEGVENEDVKTNLELLKKKAASMESLINGILDYSKVGRENITTQLVNSSEVIKNIIKESEEEHTLSFNIQEKLPILNTKKTIFHQIISNLIGNAIKYHNKENGVINIGFELKHDVYQFSIEDNGPGIEKAYHDKIFNIFQTLNEKKDANSSGVGLAIVKKSVESLGGELTLESTPGKGSKFMFTIPKK